MYLPAHFAESRRDVLEAFVLAHPFGLLLTQSGSGRLEADGVPFVLDPDPAGGPGILRAHVARANPQWRSGAGQEALVIFDGPDAYISPSWYATKQEHGKVVPTWNYVAVHAYGPVEFTEDPEQLRRLVTRLTERHEGSRAQPWAVDDAPSPFIEAQLRGIVGVRLPITRLEGKRKLSQNRTPDDRAGVKAGLLQDGLPSNQAVSALVLE